MSTWREARSAKTERQRRDQQHFTTDLLSTRKCVGCGRRLVKALADLGENTHATCGPDWPALLHLSREAHP